MTQHKAQQFFESVKKNVEIFITLIIPGLSLISDIACASEKNFDFTI